MYRVDAPCVCFTDKSSATTSATDFWTVFLCRATKNLHAVNTVNIACNLDSFSQCGNKRRKGNLEGSDRLHGNRIFTGLAAGHGSGDGRSIN